MSEIRSCFFLIIWFAVFGPQVLLIAQTPANSTGGSQTGAQAPSQLSLEIAPAIGFPIGASSPVFGLGGSAVVGIEYRPAAIPLLYFSGGLGYDYDTVKGVSVTASVTTAMVGTGLRFKVAPWLDVQAGLRGGYYLSFINDLSVSSTNPFLSANAGLVFLPGPLHINLESSYRYYFGLYNGMGVSLGLSYDLIPSGEGRALIRQNPAGKAQPLEEESTGPVEFKEVSFDDIFPVFRTYYDTHPLGKMLLHNTLGKPVSGIKVSFQIKEFMSDPKDCPTVAQLGPGESESVDLFGLFLPTILETTEKTKAQAKISLEYTADGQVQHQSLVQSISILDRNATSWTDNQRAAAFVTTKDPTVLMFSKNVTGMVKGKVQGAISPNLLTAIAFFEGLQLFGLTYSPDPIPTVTTSKQVADYIQFPRQTLMYKGGKCSDFSVLYSALLESVGIETAFITVPGHIFLAFSTDLSPNDARKLFSRPDDLIFRAEKSWIPVEVTENAGFIKAWQDGAKEWRENLSRQQADFYPLHNAWQLYEPVGLSGAEGAMTLPQSEKIVGKTREEMERFIDQEISAQVAALKNQIAKAPDPRKPANALGVLYARYGQYDRAQSEFEKLLAKEEYAPSLLNMGNILYLKGQKEQALNYYNRALAKDPKNPNVLLAVAKVNHDLENYYEVKKVFDELKATDADLAQKFAYLDLKGEEATRAAEASGAKGVVVWQE